jgi:hypothetical protein
MKSQSQCKIGRLYCLPTNAINPRTFVAQNGLSPIDIGVNDMLTGVITTVCRSTKIHQGNPNIGGHT